MNEVLVLYGSHYGSTKCYAEAIAGELSACCMNVKDIDEKILRKASLIIYGGGVYAGKLLGNAVIRKNEKLLLEKKLIVYSCGSANPVIEENRQKLIEDIKVSIGDSLFEQANCFFLRGDLLYSKMNFVHRMMMKMMVSALKKQKTLDEEAKEMVKTYGQDVHFIKLVDIHDLVQCAKKLLKEDV